MSENQEVNTAVSTPEVEAAAAVELTQKKIIEGLTNNPVLSEDEIKLGEKVFKIVYLPYDDYNDFLALLSPLFDKILGSMAGGIGAVQFSSDSSKLSLSMIFQYCKSDLPQLAYLSLKQTDPTITVEEVKKLAGSPFNLVKVVMAQLDKNKTVDDFVDFFAQISRILK